MIVVEHLCDLPHTHRAKSTPSIPYVWLLPCDTYDLFVAVASVHKHQGSYQDQIQATNLV